MVLTSIEIMAFIAATVAAVKLLVLMVNPKAWFAVVKFIYGNRVITPIVSLILAGVALKYLLAEISIVHIFAVMLFVMLLSAVAVSAYSEEMLSLSKKLLGNKKVVMKSWLALILWLALVVWVFYFIFIR